MTYRVAFLLFISNWRIIALQCCVGFFFFFFTSTPVGFCCIPVWISYKYTYIPSLLGLPTAHPHPTLPGHHRAPSWASCDVQRLPTSCLFYTWQHIYVNATLSICPTLSFPCCVHKSILYIFISIPALKIGSSVSFF